MCIILSFNSHRLHSKYGGRVGDASRTPAASHYWISGRRSGTFGPDRGGVGLQVGKMFQ